MTAKLDIAARLEQNNNNSVFLISITKAKNNKLLCKFHDGTEEGGRKHSCIAFRNRECEKCQVDARR